MFKKKSCFCMEQSKERNISTVRLQALHSDDSSLWSWLFAILQSSINEKLLYMPNIPEVANDSV